jgi:pyruvate/2-oxoglutarate dehydrogenase complex dihydrolipoamide acyltransferase (E2) component
MCEHIGDAFHKRLATIMATEILLPQLGFSMTEGVLAEWLKADGAQVKEGEPLFSLESDKSTNEVESPATGTLKIVATPGETYQVGAVLGTIE